MRSKIITSLLAGLLSGVAFLGFTFGSGLSSVTKTGATEAPSQINQSDQSEDIGLTDEQIVKLNSFRSQLNDLWVKASELKRLHDQEINPGIDRIFESIYGPSYGTPQLQAKGTPERAEAVKRAFRGSPFYAATRKLQDDLANLEAWVLKFAVEINDFQRAILAESPGKVLDHMVRNAFNDLRRKVYIITSLIGDVYDDDPPDHCPWC
jgi:hypothetical protein